MVQGAQHKHDPYWRKHQINPHRLAQCKPKTVRIVYVFVFAEEEGNACADHLTLNAACRQHHQLFTLCQMTCVNLTVSRLNCGLACKENAIGQKSK